MTPMSDVESPVSRRKHKSSALAWVGHAQKHLVAEVAIVEASSLPLNMICVEQIRAKIILASGQPINEPLIEEVIPSKHIPTKFEATSRDLPHRSKGSASHLRVLPRCSEASASHPRALHG